MSNAGTAPYVRNMAGPSLAKSVCNKCGSEEVAWAKSKKTGRPYLCNVFCTSVSDNGFNRYNAAPWSPHFKTCKANQA